LKGGRNKERKEGKKEERMVWREISHRKLEAAEYLGGVTNKCFKNY